MSIPKHGKYNLGKCDYPVCPECNQRNYEIIDYDKTEFGLYEFKARCSCGVVLIYEKDITLDKVG